MDGSPQVREGSRRSHAARACVLSALLLACASGGGSDPDRTTSGMLTANPDVGDATRDDDEGLAKIGAPCSADGARACWKRGDRLTLICRERRWDVGDICDDDQRCDSAAGTQHGTCQPIVDECVGQEPGRAFCADGMVRRCGDLVSFVDQACEPGANCMEGPELAACACKAGFAGGPDACVDIDECALGMQGCDEGTPCRNTEGSFTCGACPQGYLGGAEDQCTPALTDLATAPAPLEPPFDQLRTDYYVALPITATSVSLTPSAPAAATITIDDQRVESGQPWRSPVLAYGDTEIAIRISEEGRPNRDYTLRVRRGAQQPEILKASNGEANDGFGASMAISGDTLVVGAPNEDSNATGVNGAEDNNAASASGAAYVFVHGRRGWTQQAYLKASNTSAGAMFGALVAISGDTIAVGAPAEAGAPGDSNATVYNSGAVYVFTRRRGDWSEQARLKASNAGPGDLFGYSIALVDDTLAVGAPGEGSSATGINGVQTNNAAFGSGAVYVFARSAGTWTQTTYIKPEVTGIGDSFGGALAMFGDTLVVGAPGEDSNGTTINAPGDPQNNGAENSGAVYAFVRDGESWLQEAYLKGEYNKPSNAFGYSVSIYKNTLAVGAPGSLNGNGEAYVFERSGGIWTKQDITSLTASPPTARSGTGDSFGATVRVLDGVMLIGAYGEDSDGAGFNAPRDNDGAPNSGAAYLRVRRGSIWMAGDSIKATVNRPNQQFGSRLAISTDTIAISAMNDGQDPRSMDEEQAELGPPNSGAVYVFR